MSPIIFFKGFCMQRRDFLVSATAACLGCATLPSASWAAPVIPKSLHAPTQYAFVADKFTNFISVVDIFTGEHIESLNFGIRPHVIEMARDDSMLAVGSPEVSAIYFMDLKTRKIRRVDLPSPVYQIFFVPQSKLVAIALRDQVGMMNYEDFGFKIFSQKFDSDQRQTVLNTYYSLLFSSFSQSFWVLDENAPRIFHRKADDVAEGDWQVFDFTKRISNTSGFGVGVASPEDNVLALTTDDGSEGIIYFPHEDKILTTGPMRTTGTTNEPMRLPYIDAFTRHVIFADVEGNVALFNLHEDNPQPQRFSVDFSPRMIRTGWLESTWILGGDKALMLQSFENPQERTIFRFKPEVMDMWVTGDGKTLLFTLDEDVSRIYRCDIRSREMLEPIRVRGLAMASMIRMGSNNSICY